VVVVMPGVGVEDSCTFQHLGAIEADSKPKQEAANCVAQTARPSQAQGEGQ
jgi:hypothetical protein